MANQRFRDRSWRFWMVLGYGLLAASFVMAWIALPRFNPHTSGCFFTEGMVPYIVCQGFTGAPVVAWLLNFPYSFWYWPMFALYHLTEGEQGKGLMLLLGTLLIYAPIILSLVSYFRGRG